MAGKHKLICPGVWQVGGPELSDERDCLVYALDLGELVLIDCGCGPSWPQIAENILSAGLDPERLHTLILTHCHIDHAGAAGRLKNTSRCRMVAHAGDVPALESGDALRTAANSYSLLMLPVSVDHIMTGHRQTLSFPSGTLELIHTPGHTPGSLVVVWRAGDRVVLFGQDIHGPFAEEFGSSTVSWHASMTELLALKADILCEGHYGVYRGADQVRNFIISQIKQVQ